MARPLFDLSRLAENGKRRGFTTGSAATAASLAALRLWLEGIAEAEVRVPLPGGEFDLLVPIQRVSKQGSGAYAQVCKDGGDDPDVTHQATIWARVFPGDEPGIRFQNGEGVGQVTQPGLAAEVGGPAINPTPRAMMSEVAERYLSLAGGGIVIEVGCIDGERIAKRTFNPRLGVVGGISILGTTGIVEPMSLSAYQASIEVYVRVALADSPPHIALVPGRIGSEFAKNTLQLAPKHLVKVANFIGPALEQVAHSSVSPMPTVWVVGHPGKLLKVLGGCWNTHSKQSPMAMPELAKAAAAFGLQEPWASQVRAAHTIEHAVTILRDYPNAPALWAHLEGLLTAAFEDKCRGRAEIRVKLFGLAGTALSNG